MKNLFLRSRRRKEAPSYLRFAICDLRFRFEPRYLGCYVILVLLVFACAGTILAADANADFTAANKLYALGKFSDAAAAYEKILQTGAQSPALLFNDANAEFKAGHLGKAIAAYRRAAQLSPRDNEIRANLAFARSQVQGATVHESHWQTWADALTLNEGTLLTAALFWLTLALLAARQLRPVLVPRLKIATRVLAVLTVLSASVLGLQAAEHFSRATAVVIESEATARSGPFDDAQKAFIARDGAELSVLARHGDWIQVTDGAGGIGWLNTKQVEVLPGA
ncbi:MAG TPA: SH3 domain-containing protein [Verrucomicrobiae bacterium]|nr:SH3 domain-containing protein [Verrucomicrobiae bacterium]